jgi:hypothetical protein
LPIWKAECIPQISVVIGDVFDDFIRYGHITTIILRADPKADDIGTIALDPFIQWSGGTIALGEFRAVFLNDETMS